MVKFLYSLLLNLNSGFIKPVTFVFKVVSEERLGYKNPEDTNLFLESIKVGVSTPVSSIVLVASVLSFLTI